MRIDRLRGIVFGAGVAAALGFGAAQAAAAPGGAPGERRLVCDDLACLDYCERAGYSYGICRTDGSCRCGPPR